MISEIIVIAVTWKNTFQGWRVASRGAIDASTLTVILRDGTIYFIFLLILNILEVVTAAPLVSESVFGGYVTLFLIPMACILISRFLLNLRRISASGREMRSQRSPSTFTSRADWQTLEFASQFVGNMGALLDYADAGGDDIEEPTAETVTAAPTQETPPIVDLLRFISSSTSLSFSLILHVSQSIAHAVSAPLITLIATLYPILLYIFSPVLVFAEVALDAFVRTPYAILTGVFAALYPLYVFIGASCICAACVGLGARICAKAIRRMLFSSPRSTAPAPPPAKPRKRVSIKEEKRR
ncbi:uncharacterized protein FIBRA_09019 [Fibroporia radiculosa]|uniref:Transmembrane protein n=1 Tax=Fibroporia radiculosa TaxID=599839 RepID=J4GXT0_9APHY|nr:uncharacterized protein FIBRA_09019 [Fibroporia radiculosa]CCM06725.1 predicted protein [Fibroporia radiculosa]